MKRTVAAIIILMILGLTINAQTIMDVARTEELTWYGLDFSCARFIRFESSITPDRIKNELIKNWVISTAKTNFSFKYKVDVVRIDTTSCDLRNSTIDPDNLMTNSYYEMNNEAIEKVIAGYKTSGKGYGFVYIVESFEKSTEKVYIYVCYFKETDHKIISMRRYIGKASGIGLEHHYAGAIDDVISYSSKDFKKYSKR